MGLNLTQKLIKSHLVDGEMLPGSEIGIVIDQTLTQDSTGTMAYLQLEAMGIDRVKTRLSVAYIDHNMLQEGFENADDHLYIQTVANKYGVHFSRPGNGICHQVHLERFGVPGQTLLGSDSHTPTNGGIGMLAIGAGGLDVAAAMAGQPYYLVMPKVVKVELAGRLAPFVTAKDIILELLRRLTVKGGVGKVFEYTGEALADLSVPERATITNMGAELGATTSVFPSDEVTRAFLRAQGRESAWVELQADPEAEYDEVVTIDLSRLNRWLPNLTARITGSGQPDWQDQSRSGMHRQLYQQFISRSDESGPDSQGKTIHPNVSLVISPGSRQVLAMLAANAPGGFDQRRSPGFGVGLRPLYWYGSGAGHQCRFLADIQPQLQRTLRHPFS